MQTEKINPIMQIPTSFAAFAKNKLFIKLREQSTGSKWLYAIIMAILLSFLSIFLAGVMIANSKDLEISINDIPGFSYENGELSIESKTNLAANGTLIYIDTDVEGFYVNKNETGLAGAVNIADVLSTVNSDVPINTAVFLGKKNCVMLNYSSGQSVPAIAYTDLFPKLGIDSFNKQTVQSGYKGAIIKCFFIVTLVAIVFILIHLFFITLIWSLIGLIVNAVAKSGADFSDIYWISFYMNGAFCIVKYLVRSLLSWPGILNWVCVGIYCVVLYLTLTKADEDTGVGNDYIATPPTASFDNTMGDSTSNPF